MIRKKRKRIRNIRKSMKKNIKRIKTMTTSQERTKITIKDKSITDLPSTACSKHALALFSVSGDCSILSVSIIISVPSNASTIKFSKLRSLKRHRKRTPALKDSKKNLKMKSLFRLHQLFLQQLLCKQCKLFQSTLDSMLEINLLCL